jgi:(4S)-4-hydroxy-5-phosphonooxypentane-2,3-dione isomerase
MLLVHVHAQVRPERVEDFLTATLANARESLAEPGVLRFDVIQDQADPAHVVLTEVYRDEQAPAAHKLTPHYAAWRDAVAEMMAEPRQSMRYSVVFPAGSRGWASAPP